MEKVEEDVDFRRQPMVKVKVGQTEDIGFILDRGRKESTLRCLQDGLIKVVQTEDVRLMSEAEVTDFLKTMCFDKRKDWVHSSSHRQSSSDRAESPARRSKRRRTQVDRLVDKLTTQVALTADADLREGLTPSDVVVDLVYSGPPGYTEGEGSNRRERPTHKGNRTSGPKPDLSTNEKCNTAEKGNKTATSGDYRKSSCFGFSADQPILLDEDEDDQTSKGFSPSSEHRRENGVHQQTKEASPADQPTHSYRSSAYVQNLAEICFTVLYDARWKVPVSGCDPRLVPLFRWENGDDLTMMSELSRLYQNRSDVASPVKDDESHARSVHVACRLFYRKGPWFRIDDVYKKYYEPQTRHNNTKLNPDVEYQRAKERFIELLVDLAKLKSSGWLRSFHDRDECASTAGSTLLAGPEKDVILRQLGGKVGGTCSGRNAMLRLVQQQNTLSSFWDADEGESGAQLPVEKHVDELLLRNLARRMAWFWYPDSLDTEMAKAKVETVYTEWSAKMRYILPNKEQCGICCFRLRERPLLTLQRCCRAYLCAASGPGYVWGSNTTGWSSLEKDPELPTVFPVKPPSSATWYNVTYPGLMVRFGIASAPCSNSYEPLLDERVPNPMVQLFASQQDFCAWEKSVELRARVDYLIELDVNLRQTERKRKRESSETSWSGNKAAYGEAAKNAVAELCRSLDVYDDEDKYEELTSTFRAVCSLDSLDGCMKDKIEAFQVYTILQVERKESPECHRCIARIGVLIASILLLRNKSSTSFDTKSIKDRPWLRHMRWEGCLSYVLRDVVEFLEKQHLYEAAIQMAHILIYGTLLEDVENGHTCSELAAYLLSRRARGKIMERLVIDLAKKVDGITMISRFRKTPQREVACQSSELVQLFCTLAISMFAPSGYLPFCAIRGLARRLKCPLLESLQQTECLEGHTLGLRYDGCASLVSSPLKVPSRTKKYRDWTPRIDVLDANALDTGTPCGPCTFVSFDDTSPSIRVEALAQECYRTGVVADVGEGWQGWHNEGGHIRTLFRILCLNLLEVNWKRNSRRTLSEDFLLQQRTVFLSPYQNAPFDLHVGHDLNQSTCSFFARRKHEVGNLLQTLELSNDQQVIDLVYEALATRHHWASTQNQRDPQLHRDLLNIRSLCAVAAGCGGRQLAAVFRTLLYDYRHYSGGLPDLLLVRASYESVNQLRELVELGEWIREGFSEEAKAQLREQFGNFILIDQDDEYLDCSKTGESGGKAMQNIRSSAGGKNARDLGVIPSVMPEKMLLSHNGRTVKVECLFVEVKSHNDRLDARQEDWLNILDRCGKNARVCQFRESKKK